MTNEVHTCSCAQIEVCDVCALRWVRSMTAQRLEQMRYLSFDRAFELGDDPLVLRQMYLAGARPSDETWHLMARKAVASKDMSTLDEISRVVCGAAPETLPHVHIASGLIWSYSEETALWTLREITDYERRPWSRETANKIACQMILQRTVMLYHRCGYEKDPDSLVDSIHTLAATEVIRHGLDEACRSRSLLIALTATARQKYPMSVGRYATRAVESLTKHDLCEKIAELIKMCVDQGAAGLDDVVGGEIWKKMLEQSRAAIKYMLKDVSWRRHLGKRVLEQLHAFLFATEIE